jgi:hypothetical protein
MYKIIKEINGEVTCINKSMSDGTNISIPLAPDNSDFAQFKKDLVNGSDLQDADGNTMTTEEVTEFIATLP